jgi:nucleotide-binding universal stress UspA family protein
VDFSAFSRAALEEATSIAQEKSAELSVLHAYQNPAVVLPMSGYVGPTGDVLASMRDQLAKELDSFADSARNRGLVVRTVVIEGAPYACIVDHAKDWDADLIVMSTHGRTGLSHLLTGSVTERVVRLAPCSVLVTRARS